MIAFYTDGIATDGCTETARWADLVRIGEQQDKIEVLQLNLQIAMQQIALYRAELMNTAALLRQERAQTLPLLMALFLDTPAAIQAIP